MSSSRRQYPSDLTDIQWNLIKGGIPPARKGGRPRTTDVRNVFNAILYVNRTGCAWRYLPCDFPPWQTVYDYFWKWTYSGLWFALCFKLVRKVRKKVGRNPNPSLSIIDSQSVRAHYGEKRGWDGYKKVRGRKRHILVDSLGLLLRCKAGPANQSDHRAAEEMFEYLPDQPRRSLKKLLGDGAYRHLKSWYEYRYGINVETLTAKRVKNQKFESNLKPKRWIVERTLAWMVLSRRLGRDYEKTTICSEAIVYTAMLPILLKCLTDLFRYFSDRLLGGVRASKVRFSPSTGPALPIMPIDSGRGNHYKLPKR